MPPLSELSSIPQTIPAPEARPNIFGLMRESTSKLLEQAREFIPPPDIGSRRLAHGLAVVGVLGLVTAARILPYEVQASVGKPIAAAVEASPIQLDQAPIIDLIPKHEEQPAINLLNRFNKEEQELFDRQVSAALEVYKSEQINDFPYTQIEKVAPALRSKDNPISKESWINLIAGLVRAESRGQVDAASESGDLGLTQLKPSTAIDLAEKYFNTTYSKSEIEHKLLTNPEFNLTLGAFYLDSLVKNFGDPTLAIWAYHRGAMSVNRDIETYATQTLGISQIEYDSIATNPNRQQMITFLQQNNISALTLMMDQNVRNKNETNGTLNTTFDNYLSWVAAGTVLAEMERSNTLNQTSETTLRIAAS